MAQRIIITFTLLVFYFYGQKTGYTDSSGIESHLLYPLYHANIWHLACNIMCLWMIKCPLNIIVTFVLAVLCSFIPCLVSEPTMGLSGVLFAVVGISWGRLRAFKRMCRYNIPIIIITFFIPNVNALIHLYCLMAGYLFGTLRWKDPLAKIDPYPCDKKY